jgi:hypothetical protein
LLVKTILHPIGGLGQVDVKIHHDLLLEQGGDANAVFLTQSHQFVGLFALVGPGADDEGTVNQLDAGSRLDRQKPDF